MTFFKNGTPEQIAALRERVAILERAVASLDTDMESMEIGLRTELDRLEKLVRNASLPTEQDKAKQDVAVLPGFKTWSQRKAERMQKTHDPGFATRAANRRRGTRTGASTESSTGS